MCSRAGRCGTLLLLVAAAASAAYAQDSDKKAENENPQQRNQWFMRGRTVPGQSSAELLRRAYQRKMQKRAEERVRLSAADSATSTQTNAAVPLLNTLQPTWTSLGPTPVISDANRDGFQDYGNVSGRVNAIAVDQADATGNTVYVGAASGGVWRSTNAATANPANVQWTPLIDDQASLAVGAIALKPGTSSTILVGTGEANFAGGNYYGLGILRSTNGGSSWNLITTADNGVEPFKGFGFTSFAFSTDNTSLVVAGVSGLTNGSSLGAIDSVNGVRGIYYSTDSGATWHLASIKDAGVTIAQGSVPSVVYNPVLHSFMAAVRFHGIYSSTDGINWTRLANQPSSFLSTSACPATPANTSCPMGRGQLSVQTQTGEVFLWYVDDNEANQGIFKTGDGGTNWIAMSFSGISNCGDSSGCGTSQGLYNLEIAAVPTSGGTDLYAGAVNLFKCVVNASNPTCTTNPWLNLSHAYGCTPTSALAHFHPDQHAIDFSRANPLVIYFGNDGGIYRTINAGALNTGSCSGTNAFDNLNGTMGSLTQFVWLTVSGADGTTMLGGTQDNGTPSRTGGVVWQSVLAGDGGYSDINPSNPNEWFSENPGTKIYRCTAGPSCTDSQFGNPVASSSNMAGDVGDFYTPFMLDPQRTGQLIVGTCRIWRGPSTGVGWTVVGNAISGSDFTNGNTSTCSSSDAATILSIAAGGPTTAAGSEVIYAGTNNGLVFSTVNASAGPPSWVNRTGTINPSAYPISAIAIDPSVASGQTAYLTVMGFGTGHVFKTTNAGATWSNITGDLPDAPADAVVVDPNDPTVVYVGTDVGVFVTTNGGAHWSEYSVLSGPAQLPNVAITRLVASNTSTVKKLRVSTYGRGIFEANLLTSPVQGTLQLSATSLTFAAQTVGTTSSSQTLTLTAVNGPVGSISIANSNSAEFPSSNNCPTSLALSASCTVTVSSSPTAVGGRSGSLTITSDGVGSPQTVTLNGTGTQPSAPVLVSISPGTAVASTAGFTLTVNGSGFAPTSVVNWNGSGRPTTFISSTQLTAAIPASDITGAGTPAVTVFTPSPGGGTSAAITFFVTASTGTFPLSQLRYWPHIVTGQGYVTKMTITNLTNAPNSVVVYTLSQAGAILTTSSYTLAPAATVRFATPESARYTTPTTKWAIVNSSAAVGINLFFEVVLDPSTGAVINTVGFNDSPPLTDFTLPVEFQPTPAGFSIGRTIGIAIANITNSAGTITFKLIDQDGNILATATRPIGAFGQIALDLQLSMPEFNAVLPGTNFIGSLTVSSTVAISAIGLEDDLGPFSAIPPIPGRAK